MSELEQKVEGQEPEADAPAFDRSHPAFKAITQQLSEERQSKGALEKRLLELEEAETARNLAKEKEAGNFEQVEAKLKAQVDAKAAELEAIKANYERQQLDSTIQLELSKLGVVEGKVLSFLASEFHALEGDETVSDWAQKIASDESYSVFFGGRKQTIGAPPAASSSGHTKGTDWAQAKLDLVGKDKAKSDTAAKLLEGYVREHGKMPD